MYAAVGDLTNLCASPRSSSESRSSFTLATSFLGRGALRPREVGREGKEGGELGEPWSFTLSFENIGEKRKCLCLPGLCTRLNAMNEKKGGLVVVVVVVEEESFE
jgi:hypothetical protein